MNSSATKLYQGVKKLMERVINNMPSFLYPTTDIKTCDKVKIQKYKENISIKNIKKQLLHYGSVFLLILTK